MSLQLNLKSRLSNKFGHEILVNLNLVQFNDEGIEVLYAPALEVYGYGQTFEEAQDSFIICLEEFINYAHNKGTFDKELKRLGWKIKGSKQARKYSTPVFSELLINNPNLANIINNKNIQTHSAELPLAMA